MEIFTWAAFKLFGGKALTFIGDHWRAIALALLIGYALHERSGRLAAVKQFDDLKADIVAAEAKQVAEQAVKAAQAGGIINNAVSVAALDFEHFDLDRGKSTKAIKDLYEKPRNRNSIPQSCSLLPAGSDTEQASQTPGDPQGPPRAESECYATLVKERADFDTLEAACRITTIDFNNARAVIDADTLMYGREDN